MIFQTGLLRLLSEAGHDVVVVVPDASDPNVSTLCKRDGVTPLEYLRPPQAAQGILKTLRKYVVEDIRRNPCLWDKHQESLAKETGNKRLRRLRAKAGLVLNDVVDRMPVLRRAFLSTEAKILLRPEAVDFVQRLDTDLLVATYPVSAPEPELLLAAQSLGVKTCIHLLSWDNITAKGHFQALADEYIAWGPTMREELQTFYGVPEDRIAECGVPHFDLYFRELPMPDRPLLRTLEKGKPYVFFAMSAARYAPGETAIIRQLCSETLPGGRLDGIRVVARPHPSALSGVLQDDGTLAALKELESNLGLLVSYPDMVAKSRINWSVRDEDMYELIQLLKGAAVVINSGSTVNVEALALGRPVIVTSYDGPEERPYARSARRLKDYPHLRKLFRDGGAELVSNSAELFNILERLLATPEYHAQKRQHALRRQIGDQRGDATQKVADHLLSLLDDVPIQSSALSNTGYGQT